MLSQPVRDRLVTIADCLVHALAGLSTGGRDAVIAKFDISYGVHFAVAQADSDPARDGPAQGEPPDRPGDSRPPNAGLRDFPAPPPDGNRGPPPGSQALPPDGPGSPQDVGDQPPGNADGPPPLHGRDERVRLVSIRHEAPFGAYEVPIPAVEEFAVRCRAQGRSDVRVPVRRNDEWACSRTRSTAWPSGWTSWCAGSAS